MIHTSSRVSERRGLGGLGAVVETESYERSQCRSSEARRSNYRKPLTSLCREIGADLSVIQNE